ncbi:MULTISPECIES: Cro/CI family transcriptional regulator [Pseudomonas]|uniref:Cro/CI family transcriptional regulator n=1 Tax=Pseudomonas TaxID=286 RepID=UPI0008DA3267|nr:MULTISPECIES: Cro/CI family transcriptional regulator [unclassified Pseudomonas]OHW37966.1 hypothetical protein BHC62_06510 [Pseudomonas sp. 06C 126]QHG24379.1 hypothetical protein GDV60_16530 [Pseudomonas sp. DTU12.1]TDR46273.1 Cro protein [Pseudomonas brenneri]HAY42218.1 hypothetical protein [Micrococcaceae bacterium]
MQRTPLKEFVTRVGQIKAAEELGMTQGGISKALRAGREVYVIEQGNGKYKAEEIKPFPGQVQRLAS